MFENAGMATQGYSALSFENWNFWIMGTIELAQFDDCAIDLALTDDGATELSTT